MQHRILRAAALLLPPMVAAAVLTTPLEAQYVDPGSASVLWQLLLAGVFGVVFSFRRYLVTLVRMFMRRFRRSGSEPRGHE